MDVIELQSEGIVAFAERAGRYFLFYVLTPSNATS